MLGYKKGEADYVEKVVTELEKMINDNKIVCENINDEECHKYNSCGQCIVGRTIDVVKRGGRAE